MKYLDDWKAFEGKIEDLVSAVGKNDDSVDVFFRDIFPDFFMKQFVEFLKKKYTLLTMIFGKLNGNLSIYFLLYQIMS